MGENSQFCKNGQEFSRKDIEIDVFMSTLPAPSLCCLNCYFLKMWSLVILTLGISKAWVCFFLNILLCI